VLRGLALIALTLCARAAAAPPPAATPPTAASQAAPPAAASQVAPPPTTGDVGTAHPTSVEAVAPDGRWVVLCQARRDTNGDGQIRTRLGYHGDFYGDRMEPYLIMGGGAGTALDLFVAAAPGGRHLVFVAQGRLILLDTHTRRRGDLSARGGSARDDRHPLGPDPIASFDPAGERLLYLRGTRRGPRAIVRDLATGVERALDHGGGVLWRAALVAPGWAVAWVRPEAGRSMRLPITTLAGRRCRGPIASYSTFGGGLGGPVRRLVPLDGGSAVDPQGVVGIVGHSLLRRLDDASVVWERGGRRSPVAPAACGGKVLAFHRERGPVLVACTKEGKPAPAYWFGATRRPLGLKLEVADSSPHQHRVWVQWQGRIAYVVDVETGVVQQLPNESREVAAHGARTFFHRSEYRGFHPEWNGFVDWRRGVVSALPVRFPDYPRPVTGGSWLAVQPATYGDGPVIDMSTGAVVGSVDRDPLAITSTGWVLMEPPSRGARITGPPFAGPLRWYRPGPPPPRAPRQPR
jgi:hypothetical protein